VGKKGREQTLSTMRFQGWKREKEGRKTFLITEERRKASSAPTVERGKKRLLEL